MKCKINNLKEMEDLKQNNFNNPTIKRLFILNLIKNYLDNFAFGFTYNNSDYTVIKKQNEFYIRNNNNYKFEFPHCHPPITDVYDVKSNNIEDIVKYILRQ
jgi:hypothetical protein